MAANYSILAEVELDVSKIQDQLDKASKKLKLNSGSGLKDLNQDMQDLNLTYQAANTIFSKCTEAISDMVSQVMELDKATIELQKVSDLQGGALDNYVKKLGEAGERTAKTTSQMVEAATMFRKSGFGDSDSAKLAEIASMYQNIADTEVSAGDAAASIVSQMRAFGEEGVDFASHVIDAYNEVANNFSVGTNDLSNAMEVAASGMVSYGNSFEEILG